MNAHFPKSKMTLIDLHTGPETSDGTGVSIRWRRNDGPAQHKAFR